MQDRHGRAVGVGAMGESAARESRVEPSMGAEEVRAAAISWGGMLRKPACVEHAHQWLHAIVRQQLAIRREQTRGPI